MKKQANPAPVAGITARFLNLDTQSSLAVELVHTSEHAPYPLLDALSGIGWVRSLKGAMPRKGRNHTVMIRAEAGTAQAGLIASQTRRVLQMQGINTVGRTRVDHPVTA